MNSSSSTAPGAHFSSADHPLFRSGVCSYFWSLLWYHYRPRRLSNGKSAKVLFMAICGMRVAMDIGVSCDHVSRFYRHLWHATVTIFGSEYMYKGTAAPLVRWAVAKRCGETSDEFVSEFGFGRRQPPDSGATNLLRGSLIKARCRLVSWE